MPKQTPIEKAHALLNSALDGIAEIKRMIRAGELEDEGAEASKTDNGYCYRSLTFEDLTYAETALYRIDIKLDQ